MGIKSGFLYFLFCLCVLVFKSSGHPQCLDSRPPFQAEAPLSFCSQFGYSDFGCCTVNDDRNLQIRYSNMERRLSATQPTLWARCKNYTKTFLCQSCSPYAAHIFDSEISVYDNNIVEPRRFPGLCGSYCSKFHQSCYDIVQFYLDEMGSGVEERRRIGNARNESTFCSSASLTDVDYCYPELLTNPVLNGNISLEQITKEGCLCVEPINEVVLRNPIFLKHADDGSNRMFVGEQIGMVHIFYPDGTMLPEPFLDIQYKIHTTAYKGDERGMLGMIFHPRYKENGKFYMYYSTSLSDFEADQGDHKIRIEEMKVSSTNPNKADEKYSRIILEVVQPFWNHNGGEILFGDDGYLYIFVGDGGKAGDTLRAAQNLTTFLGKVLRVDVDVPANNRDPYGIPADNPFIKIPGAKPEIYAYGVRNIWRCGKDLGDPKTGKGKGRVVCGDVGQSAREELNLLERGANYGWNLKEGIADYCSSCPRGLKNISLTDPIFDYPHSVGKSVTGGHFYRGCHSPNLNGFYIYGDFMSGRLFRLLYDEGTKQWNNKELTMCGTDRCTLPLDNLYTTSIISFGEDEDGEIYMLSTSWASTSAYEGHIYRIVDPSRRGNPANCRSARPDFVRSTTPETTTTSTTTPHPTTPKPTTPKPTTPKPTTPKPTTRMVVINEKTTRPTSAGVIPLFHGSRMAGYLDYFKQKSRTTERQKLKSKQHRSKEPLNRWEKVQQQLLQNRNQRGHLGQTENQQRQKQKENIWQTKNQTIRRQHHEPKHLQHITSSGQNTQQGHRKRQQQNEPTQKRQTQVRAKNLHSQRYRQTPPFQQSHRQQQELQRQPNPGSLQKHSSSASPRFITNAHGGKSTDSHKSSTRKQTPSQTQVSGKLTFHGIKIRRCTQYPKELCDTNRIVPKHETRG